jgi:ABC-type dipeptide/oligopeptide/nickel transport system permease component
MGLLSSYPTTRLLRVSLSPSRQRAGLEIRSRSGLQIYSILMFAFIVRRLALTLPVVWIVVTLVFALIHFVPGDPVAQMLGEGASVTEVERLRHELGLDRPFFEQYRTYMMGVFRGDLGMSFRNQQSVTSAILARYPATIELAGAATIFSLILAIPLGVLAAIRRGRGADRAVSFFTLLGVSLPNFALGPMLILLFSITLGLLPVSGRGGFSHLLLPAVTLGGALAAITTRMVRGSMLEEIKQDYVRTARAKGLTERIVLFKHAFMNGLIPVITVLGLQAGTLLAGAIITERIFSWPGLGRLTIDAIFARDYPLVQGCILAITLTYILINLVTDLLYSVVDPRIRYD